MAEVISIKIEYTGLSGQAVVKDLAEIAAWAKQLNSTVIKPRIDTSQIDALTKSQARAIEITAKEAKAQAELTRARASEKRADADLLRAKNQLALADKQLALETRKQETEEKKRKTAIKQTELAMKQAEATEVKVTLAEKNRKLAIEKGNTALKQKQLQEEKTKTAIENHATADARLATQQEKTLTGIVRYATEVERTAQSENRLAAQKERTAQISAREAAAQNRANAEQERGAQSGNALSTSLAGVVTRVFSLHMVLSRVVSAFRDALKTMKDVDSALVTIQKTTGFTGERLDKLTASAYELANAYGRTATEILNAASVYARAGFKDNLDQMTELSALLQNVGDLEGDVAAKFLIATNAAWQLGGSYDDLMSVIDGLNAQTNQAAVDMEGLTSGITVAGSVFASAGESVQTFAGMLGAGIALTARSGSEVGRGLRTIAMNIRQIKGELDDGEIIDAASISDAAKALHSVGISVADANGELRLTSDVLNELAERWDKLTSAEKSYLGQSLAGKRQANVLISLMQNWEEAQRQMSLYANGAGSALKENEIYLNSWEAKSKQLSAAWTKFVSNLVDTDLIKGALDGLIKLVNFLDSGFGRFIITVGGVTAAVAVLIGVVGALKSAFIALNATMAANPILLAVAAGTAAIYAISKAFGELFGNLVTTVEEYDKTAHDAYNAYEAIVAEIETLKSKSQELTDIEKNRLAVLQEEARLKQEEAAIAAGEALTGKYKVYNSSYDELQSMLEKAQRGEEGPIIAAMHRLENGTSLPSNPGGTGVPQYAGMLIGQYLDVQNALKEAKSSDEIKELTTEANNLKQDILSLATELLDYSQIMGDKFPEDAQNALKYINAVVDAFDGTRESIKKAKSESGGVVELIELWNEAQSLGIDLTKTVFGNIDTNNREVLEWTSKNLDKYKTELESWGYEAEEMIGSISTVMGTSSQYDGVEIAFSPILQTDSGPVLLSKETVDKYIFKLIEAAGKNWSKEDLLSLDWRGLEVDGVKIQGLLADIGESAIKTGEAMHYVGSTGALALAGYTGYADNLRDRLKKVSAAADAMGNAVSGVITALDGYGESSYEVYKAMVNLEHTIPGATDGLYDLTTASWEVESAQFADKNALLDFVDAARQAKFTSLIEELEKASAAALDLAGSIAMAMPGGYNDQFLEAYKAENNPALQRLKEQKADWDSWVSALRSRKDDSGRYTTHDRTTSTSDPELETRKQAVALLKSELEFLKAKGASEEEIVAKQKQIQSALHDQAEYMREIGADQAEINALSTEWWKIQNEIAGGGEDILQQHKDRVALLKSELAILESKGASTDEINAKEREIQAAIKAQADYMESVGASQTEINALTKEWWDIEKKILATHEQILDTVQKTINEYYDKAITDKEKELQLEEKILAVQQAQAALANAQKERNVRYFNAASGQWEWGANQKNVKAAQDALKKAQDDLNKYQKEQAWKEFKDAWTYISGQIKAGDKTFQEAYAYMEGKMKDIQNKYNVDMSGVLNDSVGQFKGVNKTIKELDDKTAAELSAGVKAISDQNANLATATADAKTAVGEFKDAYDAVVAKVKSGKMSFDDAYAYLKEQAKIISAKYGTDMTGALDKAIEEMETIYTDLDSIKEAVKKGKITPDNAFEIISKALDSVSQKYGQDITGKVNKILDEKGGFKDGIGGLAQAVKDGKISVDEAFGYLEDATSEVADQYGIDMTGELNTAIENMGKSSEALDGLWKQIVLNKMRMNSVSWLELDEQKKKAQASGDTALAKAIGEQQDQLHAENEALGETIGATYDKSGHWSLNGQTLYDPKADRESGEFSVGGGGGSGIKGAGAVADSDIAGLEAVFGKLNGTEKHYIPGVGLMNVGQSVADLFNVQAGARGNPMIRQMILKYGTDAEKSAYLSTGIVPASFADAYNSNAFGMAGPDLLYDVPAAYKKQFESLWYGDYGANGLYNGTAMVYKGGAGGSFVTIKNGKAVGASGLLDAGSNILLTPDGQVLRLDGQGNTVLSGETWGSSHGAVDPAVLALLYETIMAMDQSGNYTSEELYGRKYDSGGLLHGVGGIKATARDEMVLPPDITSRLLSPVSNSFVSGRMDDLRSMLGMRTQFGTVDNTRIGTQNNGDNYVMNGVTISEGQARTTTVYDLAQIARSLGAYQRS